MKVFYRREMVADTVKTYSPSPGKPAKVLADWKAHKLPIVVSSFQPVTMKELYAVHDVAYVDGVLKGDIPNGFGTICAKTARSLLYTTGAMLAAAKEAVSSGKHVCAPVSGFHHASTRRGYGYCTFNGLAVTAMELKKSKKVDRVGILDLDQHYGDGTEEIIKDNVMDWVTHVTPGGRSPGYARQFLQKLPAIIRGFKKCGVLLYQAGADAHVNDPLGGWMTTEQLASRDRIVFNESASIGLPVAWCLAGGYQKEPDGSIPVVLEIHRNTAKACIDSMQ